MLTVLFSVVAVVVETVGVAGVYDPVEVMDAPTNDAPVATSLSVTSRAPVPVNVCAAAVPDMVPLLDVPVNDGCVDVADLIPVAIV